ncbi:DUF1127 domain-containing protein [Salinicola peritrichatus]|uniref:DUF1127 domain-containing protein n=1 Tax=Salinicola peritrichatus TaxID=1267424 RepID=UPI000DA15703|nr:DUF1127 domain-containing protein [Salinicola peritrichatus]
MHLSRLLPTALNTLDGPHPAHGTFDDTGSLRPEPGATRPSYWQRWRTRRQLKELDDRQLADIGLTRAMVHRETHLAFWR